MKPTQEQQEKLATAALIQNLTTLVLLIERKTNLNYLVGHDSRAHADYQITGTNVLIREA